MASNDPDLDQRRIQHAAHERRVLLRARAIMTLSAVCCIVGCSMAVQYFVNGISIHQKWTYLALDLVAALILFGSGLGLAKSARQAHRMLNASRQSGGGSSPDFNKLSNGSQRARNLDKLK